MTQRGFSQRGLARAVGVSQPSVARWLKGIVPRTRELYVLSRVLRVPIELLYRVIPHVPLPEDVADTTSPGDAPASAWTAEDRARIFELFSKANTGELQSIFDSLYALLPKGGTPKKQELTDVDVSVKLAPVKPLLPHLLARANVLAKAPGKKTELAEHLRAPLASVSRWLGRMREPGGETTLRLLQWVQEQERK